MARGVVRSDADEIDELPVKIKSGITRLRGLDIGDEITIEILGNLVEGQKTVAEIVERVYGLSSQDEGYFSAYSRIRRGVRRLESKGLVSTGILGRERPYRLTDLAMINLARIGGDAKQISALPTRDVISYLITFMVWDPPERMRMYGECHLCPRVRIEAFMELSIGFLAC